MQFNSIPFYWVSKNPNHTFSTNQDANAANPTENLTYSHSRSDVEIYGSRHNNYKSKSNLGRRSRSISESPPTRHYSGRNSRDRQRMRHSRVSSTKYQQCLLLIRTLLQDHPQASRCIGVFGLNTNTTQQKVRELFNKFGPIERIQMVIDAHVSEDPIDRQWHILYN